MIRLLFVVVLVIALICGLIYLFKLAIDAKLKSERQKHLARFAPELLEHADVPAPVANMIVELKQQNTEAAQIMHDLLHKDRYFGTDDMENWLKKHDKKELPR